MQQYHKLKTWPAYFTAVVRGDKTFEVRKNDRGFKVGDFLVLEEYYIDTQTYSGRVLVKEVSYLMQGEFGLPPDTCIMGLR